MKHTIITLAIMIVAAAVTTPAAAQTDYKLGKVTKAELLRHDFPDIADGAKMIVLDEYVDALLWKCEEFNPVRLVTETTRTSELFDTKKIKIIEPTTSGDTEISFTLASNEALLFKRVKAVHYSIRNNRIVKRKQSFQDVKQTDLPDNGKCYSFVIPNAKAGDIFEFTYSKVIDLTESDMYDLPLQQDIPVLAVRCDLAVSRPYYWFSIKYAANNFNKIFRSGKYPITERRTIGTKTFSNKPAALRHNPNEIARLYNTQPYILSAVSGECNISIYEATDLPAITDEHDGETAKIRVIFNGDNPE